MKQVVDIAVAEMRQPTDVSELRRLLAEQVRAEDVVAVIGKSEGTGLGKDNGREAAERAIKETLAKALGIEPDAVADRVCFILSGGCPGVITPHVALVTRRFEPEPSDASTAPFGQERPAGPADEDAAGGSTDAASVCTCGDLNKRLVVGLAHSEPIDAHEVGRIGQIDKVAAAVRAALKDAAIDNPKDVHAVLVKAPALSEATIAAAAERGLSTVTRDLGIGPEGAICYSNDGSALGVAVALGEVDREAISDERVRTDYSLYSEVAFTSSGGEKTRAEVVVLANSTHGTGQLRAGHSSMRSVLDLTAPWRAIRSATGVSPTNSRSASSTTGTADADVAYVLAKMIIPGSPDLNGRRTTLHDDPHGYHVAKGMGGYLVALTTGSTTAFVSGGERNSHQGPPDGNPFAVVVRLSADTPTTISEEA
jgi:cyanuric acid amidohydrolase